MWEWKILKLSSIDFLKYGQMNDINTKLHCHRESAAFFFLSFFFFYFREVEKCGYIKFETFGKETKNMTISFWAKYQVVCFLIFL